MRVRGCAFLGHLAIATLVMTLLVGCKREETDVETDAASPTTEMDTMGATTETGTDMGTDMGTAMGTDMGTDMSQGMGTASQPAPETVPFDISGEWRADGINFTYTISQSGKTFSWQVTNQPNLHEEATGRLVSDVDVEAKWTNTAGGGAAVGRITRVVAGKAWRIEWTNGIVFVRPG